MAQTIVAYKLINDISVRIYNFIDMSLLKPWNDPIQLVLYNSFSNTLVTSP